MSFRTPARVRNLAINKEISHCIRNDIQLNNFMKQQQDFFQNVFEVVRLIPKGRVTSYGAIAKYLGTARSSRMVGWAMNAAHSQKKTVPAHRVVNRNGELTGKHHFATPF